MLVLGAQTLAEQHRLSPPVLNKPPTLQSLRVPLASSARLQSRFRNKHSVGNAWTRAQGMERARAWAQCTTQGVLHRACGHSHSTAYRCLFSIKYFYLKVKKSKINCLSLKKKTLKKLIKKQILNPKHQKEEKSIKIEKH